jgi:glycosyltransferase involved in cell wall biosynthesis
MKKIAIVPAYNEEASLPAVLRALRAEAADFDVVVINDGSTDGTSAAARAFAGVKVVDLPENIGIGGAVQTGFLFARAGGYDLAVQVDGDGQHRPSEIAKIAAPVLSGATDAAIGSRFVLARGYKPWASTAEVDPRAKPGAPAAVEKAMFRGSPFRRAGIRIFQGLNALLLGERITDSTSGFRAFNRRAIEVLSVTYPDDYPEPEAIYILKKKGLRIVEVPVEMAGRAAGRSSIGFWHSLYYMVKVCLAIFVLLLRRDERAG